MSHCVPHDHGRLWHRPWYAQWDSDVSWTIPWYMQRASIPTETGAHLGAPDGTNRGFPIIMGQRGNPWNTPHGCRRYHVVAHGCFRPLSHHGVSLSVVLLTVACRIRNRRLTSNGSQQEQCM